MTASGLDFWTIWIAASIGAAWGLAVLPGSEPHSRTGCGTGGPCGATPTLLPRGEAFFAKYGIWAVVLGRFFGSAPGHCSTGGRITRMPWVPFRLQTSVRLFLWAGSLMLPGTYLARFLPS